MITCPSCRSEDVMTIETDCLGPSADEPFLAFRVCPSCDYGINEHTEGICSCEKAKSDA